MAKRLNLVENILEERTLLATLTVTNLNDSGPGSLRQAILDSNTIAGHDLIGFNIDSGPQTIAPLSPLPYLTDSVTIDGTTQPGFSGAPIIEIDGISAGPTSGFDVTAGSTTIRGLVINRFASSGISLWTNGDNDIEGNYIGLEPDGVTAAGNGSQGITIYVSGRNRIGTDGDGVNDASERNVIASSANGNGIYIVDSSHNVIAGNFIGTDATGTLPRPNRYDGIFVYGASQFNRIGTNGDGIADAAERNLISGNTQSGLNLAGIGNDIVAGNFIGTDVTGRFALPNAEGIRVTYVQGIRIGTNGDGIADAAERNLISGNTTRGITFDGSPSPATSSNVVAGNFIGTDFSGLLAVGNGTFGIQISGAASGILVGTNADGLADEAERNLISGNVGTGVVIIGTSGNRIAGNYIGVDVTGARPLRNASFGVWLANGAHHNLVGTNADGINDEAERNIISGNNFANIFFNAGSNSNTIAGNFVGPDASGTLALSSNASSGILIEASPNNLIGGASPAARNVISANTNQGVDLRGVASTGNVISGNFIGTERTGSARLGNGGNGVVLRDAPGNRIGGTNPGERNIISGNRDRGILLLGGGSSDNTIQGNYIGTDLNGMQALGGVVHGIEIRGGSRNLIGGSAPGAGNLISGSSSRGIYILRDDATGALPVANKIQGNRVGTDVTGLVAIPNFYGIFIIRGAVGTIVGTDGDGVNDATEGNLVSGNTSWGVAVGQAGADLNVVAGNTIGLAADGSALGNGTAGVYVALGALRTRIGTNGDGLSDDLEANRIAHNAGPGVLVTEAQTLGTSIRGNSMYDNAGLGIDLGDLGPNPNDSLDADTGPSGLQNTPQLDLIETGPTTHVAGSLRSTPNTTFTIDLYASPSGFPAQGARYLGAISVTTDGDGLASFDVVLPASTSSTETLTATATDPLGNTSEFSGTPPSANIGGPYTVDEGATLTLDASATIDLDQIASTLIYLWDLDGDDFFGEIGTDAERGDEVGMAPIFSAAGLDGPTSWSITLQVIDSTGLVSEVSSFVTVTNVDPTATIVTAPSLGVRGQTVSLVGVASDPGPDTLQAVWTVLDSQGGTVASGTGLEFSFVPNQIGSYTIQFQVTDGDGGVALDTRTIEIVAAALLPDPCDPSALALVVGGTSDRDTIRIRPANTPGAIEVVINGVSQGSFTGIARVIVYGSAGDDDLEAAGSVDLPVWLHGGSGDDRLKGGAGHDILLGDEGDDLLVGGGGRDLLIGGVGADRIVGNADDDLLIAGSISFDHLDAALCAIMDEWTSERDYTTRVANLCGQGTGSLANGSVFLISDETVVHDESQDMLTGSAGFDWFFFLADDDRVTDLKDEEYAGDLDWILAD